MKKLLAMVLALVMTLSLAVSANAAFEDAKDINATYAEAVDVLAGMKVFQGYDNGKTFKPQGDITRAEVAAIVYRIYTGDVKDVQAKNYETYNKFADMAGAGWAKGYIGYCANAAFIKGYPDGNFKPAGKVTGYEALTMILRAVGYDKNNEFTGADWALNVAQIAQKNGILDNVKGVDLNAPATREVVAELLFRSINVPMVTYTAAFGYQNVGLTGDKDKNLLKNNATLGYKNFGLICGEDEDKWGRPTKVWANDVNESGKYEYNKDSAYATIAYKAAASFQAATAQCDILKELGTKKDVKGDLIVNGQKLDAVTLKDIVAKIGAQGRQLEVFYKYNDAGDTRIVMIDTFLAYVEDTADARYDKNGHQTAPYTMTLSVWDAKNDPNKLVLKDTDAAFTYEEGDYILINAYTKDNNANESGLVITGKDQYAEVIGKAESFVGAQTKIWSNDSRHTIADKEYNDAYKFLLNVAGDTKTNNFSWFLDQFGNLIGCTEIDNSGYAILKDLVWVGGKNSHAEATLVYMDGTEKENVVVNSIDGIKDYSKPADGKFTSDYDDLEPENSEYNDSKAAKIFDSKNAYTSLFDNNDTYKAYLGIALYRVETNSDESVNLQGIEDNDVIIEYAHGRTVNTNAASIKLEDGNKKININSDTQYLVRSKDAKGNYVYTPYTKANLPQFEANSADIYYYVGADGIAKYVYVKNAVTEADFGTHIFVPTKGWYTTPVKNGIGTISVYVDGTQREVSAKADVIAYLAKNTGKMFHADWSKYTEEYNADTYGYITKVTLVNEPNDALDHDGYTCDYITYGDEDDNTIGEYVKKFVKNGLLYSPATGDNWNLTADTKFIGIDGEEFTSVDLNTLKEHDIWVIGNTTKGANYQDAKVVYVGQLLNKSVELDVTVSAKEGTIAVDKDDATKITFTSVNDVTSATLTLAAREGKDILNNVLTADNTVILGGDNSPALKHDTMAVTKAANTEPSTITVWNEAGTDSETYTIAYQWPVSEKTLAGAIVSITNNDASDVMASNKTGYATFASALANASKLEVGDATAIKVAINEKADDAVSYANFKNTVADITEQLFESVKTSENSVSNSAITLTISNTGLNFENGDTLVLKVFDQAADQTYFVAFNIVK